MVNPGIPNTGQSSTTPLDGEYMSSQQLLDILKNQRVIGVLEKNPTMILPLILELPYDQFIATALRHEGPNIESDNMRSVKSKSSHPAKRTKYATSIAKTPTPKRGACFNCKSKDHYANECPRPLSCRYCKGLGHLIPTCPKLQSKRKGKLNALPTSSDPSS